MTWRSIRSKSRLEMSFHYCQGVLDEDDGFGDGYMGDGLGGGVDAHCDNFSLSNPYYESGGDSVIDSSQGDGRSPK